MDGCCAYRICTDFLRGRCLAGKERKMKQVDAGNWHVSYPGDDAHACSWRYEVVLSLKIKRGQRETLPPPFVSAAAEALAGEKKKHAVKHNKH